jgi:S-adenosylmethionine decarboxylase
MAETSRLSVIATPEMRPAAHGFEQSKRRGDGARTLEVVPGGAVDGAKADERLDHFIERDGMRFAGSHLIVDLWHATNLDDLHLVEQALREATIRAGATLLNIDLHHFTPNGGISGVAVLAESHISIHTWPERAYAAVDVFMCGDAEPHKAVEVLREAFMPGQITLAEHKRGVVL